MIPWIGALRRPLETRCDARIFDAMRARAWSHLYLRQSVAQAFPRSALLNLLRRRNV